MTHAKAPRDRGPIYRSLFALAACASCGGAAAPPAETSQASPAPSAMEPTTPARAASAEPPPQSKPLDLTNDCPKDIRLYFGDQPGDGHGESGTVAPGSTIPVPRRTDGNTTVWVVDERGFGLASVQATRRMRHVRIDATCARIEAGSSR